MTLPTRFRRSLASSYLVTATVGVIAVVMTPVLVSGLGTKEYGIWAVVTAFVLYLKLLDFGFGKATSKYVAEHAELGDRQGLGTAVVTSFWVLGLLGLGAVVLGGLVALAAPALLNVGPELEQATRLLVLIVVVDMAISIPADTFGWGLIGLQRFDLLNATLIAICVAQAVGWAIVLGLGGGLVVLGIVTCALSLVGQLARFLLFRRLVPGLPISPRRVDRTLVRPFAGLSLWLAATDMSLLVLFRIDTIVTGLAVGVAAAGIYAVGQKLPLILDQLMGPISKAFFPHSTELAARGDAAALGRSVITGTRITLGVVAPVALTLALLAGPGLRAWVGEGFEEAELVVVYLAAAGAVAAVGRTGLFMLQGTGRARGPALIFGAEALLNVILSVVLASEMGLRGVALGTLVAAVVVNLGVFVPYMCRQFELPLASFLAALGRSHGPPLIVAGTLGWLVASVAPGELVWVLPAALAVMAAYLATFALTGLERSERQTLARWVRLRFRPLPAP